MELRPAISQPAEDSLRGSELLYRVRVVALTTDAGSPDAGPLDAGGLTDNAPLQVPFLGGPVLYDGWLVTLSYPGVPGALGKSVN